MMIVHNMHAYIFVCHIFPCDLLTWGRLAGWQYNKRILRALCGLSREHFYSSLSWWEVRIQQAMYLMVTCCTVTVLWREEGYSMKYCLSPRDFQKAQAIFHLIPWLKSQFSHSQLPLLANIFSYWLRELAIFSRIGFVSWPNTGPYTP